MFSLFLDCEKKVQDVLFGVLKPSTRNVVKAVSALNCHMPLSWIVNASEETLVEENVDLETSVADGWHIVLYNDDHNTFDHVIECLMAYCGHEVLQAEQCALIVHTKGKCSVKTGDFDELEPICTALLERDLTAEVEPS